MIWIPFVVIPAGNPLITFCFARVGSAATIGSMRREFNFWVYILSSRSRSLYIGVTNNLRRRVYIHREARPGTYTARYNIHRLVYFEHFQIVGSAIEREKELKHWTRAQKIALIESMNPTWEDLGVALWPDMSTSPARREPVRTAEKADSLRE